MQPTAPFVSQPQKDRAKFENFDVSLVIPPLRAQALQALKDGDADTLVGLARSDALSFVADNICTLKARGIYERALVTAFTTTRTNHSHLTDRALSNLFGQADRKKLREAGDAIPRKRLTLYRGVAGVGRRRRLRGYSRTNSLQVACWFALRFSMPHPAVLTATVRAHEILCCKEDRSEREFIICPSQFERMKLALVEMEQHFKSYRREMEAAHAERLAQLRERQCGAVHPP
jgi:hypothetical protein